LERVSDGERVILAQLQVETRADIKTAGRRDHGCLDRILQQRRGIESYRLDERIVIHHAMSEVEEEGRAMAQRPAKVPIDKAVREIRLVVRVWIARVEDAVAIVYVQLAAVFLAAGFSEDLDAAHAQAVVLGRKRILVDADFTDRAFGWQPAAAE